MFSFLRTLSLTSAITLAGNSIQAAGPEPFVTINVESFEALNSDASKIAAGIGQQASVAALPFVLGVEVVPLIDPAKPWHAAIWMETIAAPPIIAIVVPVEDFEAFQAAIQTSMIGQLGATYYDSGDNVLLLMSKPGVPVPEGWSDVALAYASEITVETDETVELSLALSDELKMMAVSGMEMSKQQVTSALSQPELESAGMSAEQMSSIMGAYFSFAQAFIGDTESFSIGLSVESNSIVFSMGATPAAGSGFAEFAESQNVEIADLGSSVDWSSDMAMVMSLSDLPDSWMPFLNSIMEAFMPFYGLEKEKAPEWVSLLEESLPFKGVYRFDFEDGMSFSGFYDIVDGSPAEVYESWIEATEILRPSDGNSESYYSKITVERAAYELDGCKVDRITTAMNLDHPALGMPEQKEMMEQLFAGGEIVYEMVLADSRIYIASEGQLDLSASENSTTPAPIALTSDTRALFALDFGAMMRLAMSATDEPMPFTAEDLDSGIGSIAYALEIGDAMTLKMVFPISLFEFFQSLEQNSL